MPFYSDSVFTQLFVAQLSPFLAWLHQYRSQILAVSAGLIFGWGNIGLELIASSSNQSSVQELGCVLIMILTPTLGHVRFVNTVIALHGLAIVQEALVLIPSLNQGFSTVYLWGNFVITVIVCWVFCGIQWSRF